MFQKKNLFIHLMWFLGLTRLFVTSLVFFSERVVLNQETKEEDKLNVGHIERSEGNYNVIMPRPRSCQQSDTWLLSSDAPQLEVYCRPQSRLSSKYVRGQRCGTTQDFGEIVVQPTFFLFPTLSSILAK